MHAMISSLTRAPVAGAAVLTLVATAVVVFTLMNDAGQGSTGAGDTSPSTAASPSPTGVTATGCLDIANLTDVGEGPTPLPSGCWFVDAMPMRVQFTVPQGWSECCHGESGFQLVAERAGSPDATGRDITLWIPDGLYADPCNPRRGQYPPSHELGPSVDDFVAGLTELQGFESTPARDVTFAGYSGKELQLIAPDQLCQEPGPFWSTTAPEYFMNPGEVMRVIVLDVDGVRLMIKAATVPAATLPVDRDELDAILESMQIRP
jgi:hypothetical protein